MNPQDLFNDIKAIKAQLDELSKRPAPATAEQLEQVNDRPITLDAKSFAQHVLPDLKKSLPTSAAIQQATDEAVKQMSQMGEQVAKTIDQAARDVPREIRVTGDVYGFTTFKAALIYGLILATVCLGSWLICNHYREQAQATVIYQQAQEVIRERDYYYNQIQSYRGSNPTYSKLFPEYTGQRYK